MRILRFKLRPAILRENSRQALINGAGMCPRQTEFSRTHRATQNGCCISEWEYFGRYSNQNSSFALWRESARHYPTVTGTPARFILRIGWAKRSPPGRGALRLRAPANLGEHFSALFLFWNPHLAASPSVAAGSCPAFYFERPRRNHGPTPCNNFPEMKRMQGQ